METLFKNICEEMVQKGHSVNVLTWNPQRGVPSFQYHNGVAINRVSSVIGRYGFPLFGIPEALRLARGMDIIHAATFSSAPLAWIASRMYRIPIILTIPEVWIGRWRQYTSYSPLKSFIHDILERLIFILPYDHYVGISNSTSERLRQILPRKSVSTIYCGFSAEIWKSRIIPTMIESVRRSYGIADSDYLVFAWGRPGASKGFECLVESFPRILKNIPNAKMLIALNDAPEYFEQRSRIIARSHEKITFIPSLPLHDLIDIAHASDCIVVPSLTEGFGYTTLEAVSTGVPVVASNTTSIPEVIGGKYLLFDVNNYDSLADNVVLAQQNKYNNVPIKSFPWSRTISLYQQAYFDLIDKRANQKNVD